MHPSLTSRLRANTGFTKSSMTAIAAKCLSSLIVCVCLRATATIGLTAFLPSLVRHALWNASRPYSMVRPLFRTSSGVSDFEALRSAIHARSPNIILYTFDLLHLDGRDIRQQMLSDRRTLLKRLVGDDADSRIQVSDEFDGGGAALFAACRDIGLEGIVSKHAMAPYRNGRSKTWLKTKCFTEFHLRGGRHGSRPENWRAPCPSCSPRHPRPQLCRSGIHRSCWR